VGTPNRKLRLGALRSVGSAKLSRNKGRRLQLSIGRKQGSTRFRCDGVHIQSGVHVAGKRRGNIIQPVFVLVCDREIRIVQNAYGIQRTG
jgi:hypothetical protein